MKTICFRSVVLLLAVMLSGGAFAQTIDSLNHSYTQELDTRTWRLESLLRRDLGGVKILSLVDGKLTMREIQDYKPQWIQEAGFRLEADRRVHPRMQWITEMAGLYFKDQEVYKRGQAGQVDLLPADFTAGTDVEDRPLGRDARTGTAEFRSGMQVQVNDNLEAVLLAGGAYDQRLEGRGGGFSGRGEFQYVSPDGTLPNFDGYGKYNHYGERQYYSSSIYSIYQHRFTEAINRLSAQWRQNHSDLFRQNDGAIYSRVENHIMVNNRLMSPMGERYRGVYDLYVQRSNEAYRNSDYGARRQWKVDNQIALQGRWENSHGEAYFRYAIRDFDDGILVLRRVRKIGGYYTRAVGRDSVTVHYSTLKSRDDSPDTTDFSDEDELIHEFEIRSLHRLSENTLATVELSVFLDHLVNLNAERSAGNNWNRVFRLSPSVYWTPAVGWRNAASFTVMANYTIYDFEAVSDVAIQSRAFRRWSAADTLTVPIDNVWSAELAARIDLEDLGRMVWADFTQELFEVRQSRYYTFAIQRTLWSKLELMAGYRIHYRREDRFEQEVDGDTHRYRARTYYATGPQFRLTTRNTARFRVYLEGNLIHVDDSQRSSTYNLDTVYLSASYLW